MDISLLNEKIHKESAFVSSIIREMQNVIVGQSYLLDRLLIGLLTGGHILVEGVPGLAKTLAVRTIADCFKIRFQRIQFTPDLLPADLIGTMIYNQKTGEFIPHKGPIFTNILLADEINRSPAKVQSALLEAMQELQVTIGGNTFIIEQPFLVMATQNPIEQEGTYPLPEAQVDRFMMKLKITYPSFEEEKQVLERALKPIFPKAQTIASKEDILQARQSINSVYIDDKVKDYILNIVFATRYPEKYGLKIKNFIAYGGSPRATIYLALAGRAYAFLRGRGYVTPADIKAIGKDVLRHRIILTYEAEAEEITTEEIIEQIFGTIEVP